MNLSKKATCFQLMIFLIPFFICAGLNGWNWKSYVFQNGLRDIDNGDVQGCAAFEQGYMNVFPGKNTLISVNGMIRKFIGQREMNGIVRLNNGWLTTIKSDYNINPVDMNIQGIATLNKFCEKKGMLFLYVQPPFNISKYDDELPIGVKDCRNEALDYLMDGLIDENVNAIDLRDEMEMDGLSSYDFFYKTDHHWNMEGGFYAYTKIAKWIEENTATYLDETLLNFDNYAYEIYEKAFLGSSGKRVGTFFGGVDEYHLVYPKKAFRIYNDMDGTVGEFREMVISYDELQKSDLFDRYLYDYCYERDFAPFRSLDAKTDLKVLLLTDSYQHGINPYMLLTYKQYRVDSYLEVHANTLESLKPDIVVMIRYAGNIMNDERAVRFVQD